MQIKLVIKGLAICYHKTTDGIWRVIFPFDGEHRIKFSIEKHENGTSTVTNKGSLAVANSEILFETTNAKKPDAVKDDNFSEFIDITANYAHFNGIKLKDNWQSQGVIMRVPDATFFMEEISINGFLLTPREHVFGVDLGRIGEVVGANILIQDGGDLKIKVNGAEITEPLQHADGVSYTLTFDNDCDSASGEVCKEDFVVYYGLLEDIKNPELQFTTKTTVPKPSPDKNSSLLDELLDALPDPDNPLILCGGVYVSNTNHPSFP